jgi:hypothetical protein
VLYNSRMLGSSLKLGSRCTRPSLKLSFKYTGPSLKLGSDTCNFQNVKKKKKNSWTRVSNSGQRAGPEFQTRVRELDPSFSMCAKVGDNLVNFLYLFFLFTKIKKKLLNEWELVSGMVNAHVVEAVD